MRSITGVALLLSMPLCAMTQEKGAPIKVGKLTAPAPADWKKEKPANLLRSYQFNLPGEKDHPDASVVIFPESHPSAEKSFPRWKAQFIPPEGKTIADISTTGNWEVTGATATYLDMTGTWKYKDRPQDPKSKEMLLDDHRVIWVIIAEKEEATHIRLSGPAVSVEKHYKAFESWVKSLK
jgi:hypothetical protein